jgi:hypothetical protein
MLSQTSRRPLARLAGINPEAGFSWTRYERGNDGGAYWSQDRGSEDQRKRLLVSEKPE